MTRATIAGGVLATVVLVLVVFAFGAGHRVREQDVDATTAISPATTPSTAPATAPAQGFLYGRVTAVDGAIYEGRLRWGGDEEAFWGESFNGYKTENPWVSHAPSERLRERRPIAIFGFEIAHLERPIALGRPFMARFGDIARIEARGRKVLVTLKSGTLFRLDRFDASDFDDGVRVWDGERGVVDLDTNQAHTRFSFFRKSTSSGRIRIVELLPTARPTARFGAAPVRLHGTVRTRQGDFTGFVEWDRHDCVGSDEIDGRTAKGEIHLPFDTIRSVARQSRDSSRVTLRDGREIVLSGTREVGHDNRGIYVDDLRYGRVLISWNAFVRLDFDDLHADEPESTGPAYDDFPPGRPLTGSVTTRTGRRFAGRLVYDLDESETTETLDAPSEGVDYTLPFGLIASIVLPAGEEGGAQRARVSLQSGEELHLERTGDLGEKNTGLLVFVGGSDGAEHVPWTDVARIDFDRPPVMYPLHGR